MKIIIEHGGKKRVIEGPFTMWADIEARRALDAAILLGRDNDYGWLEIPSGNDVEPVEGAAEPWE